ncbi:hypothetical protein [Bifidobacterium samirii]|uniref:hypothetical protein n=1 Tax=Bifidobacterium samirii TaxID=2306974 RepID=UPI0013DFA245|nr:hypothetical protein [Bifidobacterium samirii]
MPLLLGGCGTRQTADPDATGERLASSLSEYAQQLLDEGGDDIGETQRAAIQRVIDTGEVSRSDYEAAYDGYTTCMTDRGHSKPEFYTTSNGVKQPYARVSDGEDTSTEEGIHNDEIACTAMHISVISVLYQAQVGNPNLYSDHDEGAVDCLKRAGLVPKDYTIAQYRDDVNTMNHVDPGETPDTTLDRDDPGVQSCMVTNGHILIGDPADL